MALAIATTLLLAAGLSVVIARLSLQFSSIALER
jgi:hypothetical protein